jgi:hypothetical protein
MFRHEERSLEEYRSFDYVHLLGLTSEDENFGAGVMVDRRLPIFEKITETYPYEDEDDEEALSFNQSFAILDEIILSALKPLDTPESPFFGPKHARLSTSHSFDYTTHDNSTSSAS